MSVAHPGRKRKMQIVISCGLHEIATLRACNVAGLVEWNEILTSPDLHFPADVSQIPDIFIYLTKGPSSDRKVVSYARYSARDLLSDALTSPLQWIRLQEELANNELADEDFPGNILLRLGFGKAHDVGNVTNEWKDNLDAVKMPGLPYQLRVHVYQGRGLPASDANGMMDPYLKIRFQENEQMTSVKQTTKDPCWYETKCFEVNLCSIEYAPQVNNSSYIKRQYRYYSISRFPFDSLTGKRIH